MLRNSADSGRNQTLHWSSRRTVSVRHPPSVEQLRPIRRSVSADVDDLFVIALRLRHLLGRFRRFTRTVNRKEAVRFFLRHGFKSGEGFFRAAGFKEHEPVEFAGGRKRSWSDGSLVRKILCIGSRGQSLDALFLPAFGEHHPRLGDS